jgi:hypothetical protein
MPVGLLHYISKITGYSGFLAVSYDVVRALEISLWQEVNPKRFMLFPFMLTN